jgi:glycosyltransferase involved in cell wall biosynthesis
VNATISVVVPVHNGAAFYASAIESIAAQEWPSVEIVVVDDGSTDNLAKCVRGGPAVRYIHQEQHGPAAARNTGVREASAPLIAFLDVDDRWTQGHLARLADALIEQPDAGFAQGLMRQFMLQPDGRTAASGPYRMPYLGSCLFRREVLEQRAGFDERMLMGEDYDLILRCWENDVARVCVPQVSLLYRRHAGNMTRGKNREANLEVLQRRIHRIRSGVFDPAQPRCFPFETYAGDLRDFDLMQLEVVDPCSL